MSKQKPIYFSSIRRMMIAFSTIFREMYITRQGSDGTTIQDVRVPLEYGSKAFWFRKMQKREIQANQEVRTNLTLPRMSFVMGGLEYDSARKMNTMNYASNELATDMQGKQLAPVPYNVNVQLSVWAQNLEDLLMIVEQILPLFSPQINIRIREVDDLDIWNDVDIVLNGGPQIQDNYEQGFETNRIITCDFDIVLKGNVYPPIYNQALIHKTFTRFDNAYLDPAEPLSEVEVSANQTSPPDYDKNNSTTDVEVLK